MASIIELARQFRRDQTPAEKVLWAELRNRKLGGYKFLRQHPILYEDVNGRSSFFVGDFYCAEVKLVVELDGGIHLFQREEDRARDWILKERGISTLRFANQELQDMDLVLLTILRTIADLQRERSPFPT